MSSAEKTLFLSLIGSGPDAPLPDDIPRLIGKRLDWDSIVKSATVNRMAPLVYHNLKRSNGDAAVPAPVWRELETAYHHSGFQNTLLYIELRRILRLFGNAGIDVIVLKGAALAEGVWKNIALREMVDIDLLVREGDLDRADDMLTEMGYVWYEGYRPRDWYKQNHHHLAPRHNPAKKIVVEIHRNIVPPNDLFQIDASALWKRAESADLGGVGAKVLSSEDVMIHMCLHLSLNGSFAGQIRTLADICRVIDCCRDRIDWNWITQESIKNNFAKFLYYPLFLAMDILDAKIDGEVLKTLRIAANMHWYEDGLVKAIARRIILSKNDSSSLVPWWVAQELCADILRKDRFPEKFASLARIMSLPPDSSDKDAPPKGSSIFLRFACAIRRIASLFLRFARMMIKKISRKVGVTFAG